MVCTLSAFALWGNKSNALRRQRVLSTPKQDEEPPFLRWTEIEAIIGRGVTDDEEKTG